MWLAAVVLGAGLSLVLPIWLSLPVALVAGLVLGESWTKFRRPG